jgi:hypothetical protein
MNESQSFTLWAVAEASDCFCWQVRRYISKTKGGHYALDSLRDTFYTLVVGILQRLCNGWAYPHSARHCGHCPDSRPYTEKKVITCLEEAR